MTLSCNKTRDEMIKDMVWLTPESGGGFGICSFGASFIWSEQRPTADKPDWKSIVFIKGPAEKYTDEEIKKLYQFSVEKTAEYDRLFNVRMGANAVVMDKLEGERTYWLRKRMTWECGPMYSETLDDAIAVFMEEKL